MLYTEKSSFLFLSGRVGLTASRRPGIGGHRVLHVSAEEPHSDMVRTTSAWFYDHLRWANQLVDTDHSDEFLCLLQGCKTNAAILKVYEC